MFWKYKKKDKYDDADAPQAHPHHLI